jgi:protein SCO1/2
MRKRTSIWIFIAIVLVVPFTAFALVTWYEKKLRKLPVYYSAIDRLYNTYQFTNQENKKITFRDWDNKIVVVDFFFTHCVTICPKLTTNLAKIQDAYKDDESVVINSFSVDPERDSASQLKKYGIGYSVDEDKWNLLTGDKKDIYRLARNSFRVVVTDGDGGPTDFIHTERLVLVDKQKRIRGYYDGTDEKEVKQLIRDIKKLKNEN